MAYVADILVGVIGRWEFPDDLLGVGSPYVVVRVGLEDVFGEEMYASRSILATKTTESDRFFVVLVVGSLWWLEWNVLGYCGSCVMGAVGWVLHLECEE